MTAPSTLSVPPATSPREGPALSVLIPTYNYGRFLAQAIDSVLAQTVRPREVVVADDGSTDDTAAIVAGYGDAIRYRRFDHAGVYAVRQAMLAELRGDWFLNLDADDWIEADFLKRALAVVMSQAGDGSLAFVYPDIRRFGEIEDLREFPEFDTGKLKLGNYVVMNSLIRLDAARQVGFDPRFNDGQGDYDFYLGLAKLGYRGVRLPGGLMHVRVHSKSISGAGRTQFRHVELAERILAKHAGFFSAAEAGALRLQARDRMCRAMWQRAVSEYRAGHAAEAAALGSRLLREGAGAHRVRGAGMSALAALLRRSHGRLRLPLR
ncbi:MAG: glycosyltransferase family A protein [Kiritimatiellae bacterium]|nr:glycosyltransferase family A protein [Kiritimatiellia bacterium]